MNQSISMQRYEYSIFSDNFQNFIYIFDLVKNIDICYQTTHSCGLVAYQTSWVIQCQSHRSRTAVILFAP